MKIKLVIIVLISSLVMSSFTVISVYGKNDELDTTLLEEHEGGLLDYTKMYGLEREETKPITQNRYLRSSMPQKNNYIAIMVEFPDKTGTSLDDLQTLSKAEAVMNKGNRDMITPYGNAPIISLKEYVEKYTYNKMTTQTTFFPQDRNGNVVSVKLSKNRSYYMKKSSSNPNGYTSSQAVEREKELINEILSKSKESIERVFNASDLDKNNDGKVDAISFFVEADKVTEDKVEWSDLLWSHKISGMNLNVTLKGKKVDTYNLINTYDSNYLGGVFSMNQGTYGTIIHEYMHVLGLVDLYRYNSTGNPVGFYDVMAATTSYNPQGILAYMTSEYNNLGWNNLTEINRSTSITLNRPQYTNPNEKRAVKIVSPVNKDEYFIVEYYEKRNKVNTSETSINDGVVVYRINSKVKDGNMNGTTTGRNDYLYIFRPNETGCGKGEGNLNQAVLSKNGRSSFGKPLNTTSGWNNDTLFYSNGTNSGITINITSSSSNSITLDINVPIVQGDGTTTKPYLISSVNDFDLIRKNSTKVFKLLNDIDLSNVNNFQTISNFSGTLDGDGFTIKNLTINNQSGFITNLSSIGIVKNLNFENVTITNSNTSHTGVFGNVSGKLENIAIKSGKISNQASDNGQYLGTGAIAGVLSSGGIIQDCYSSANVTQGINVGGLIGLNKNGTIQNCYANGTVNGGKKSSGGIIGSQYFISYSQYKQPNNVFYDISKTKQNEAVGMVYGSDKLTDNKTGKEGFIGVDLLKQINLDISGINEKKLDLTIKANPSTSLNKSVMIKDLSIATYNSATEKIKANKVGQTELVVSLPVGKNTMTLSSTIKVINSNIPIKLNYQAHVADYGWLEEVSDGKKAGTTGKNKQMEAIKISLTNNAYNGTVEYSVHVQDYGWMAWTDNGKLAGTTGKNKQIEAIKIRLTDELENEYDIYYRVHAENLGWLDWASNGKAAGSAGYSYQIEAIEIKLVRKRSSAPGATVKPYVQKKNIKTSAHVADYGWLSSVYDGSIAGTIGKCKQMEAIKISLENPAYEGDIEYRVHSADIGWQSWTGNGETAGVTGRNKQMEAIEIRFTGEMEKEYDIYYRAHIADYGWLDWTANGKSAGSEGLSKRIEAIEIKVVQKGGSAPGKTVRPFIKK